MIKVIILVNMALLAIGWVLFFVYLSGASNILVIRFDQFQGINFLGTKYDALGILTVGSVINLVNGGLAAVFHSRNRFLTYVLLSANVLASLLILIIVSVIISVN